MSKFLTTTYRKKKPIELKWIKENDPLVPETMCFLREYFYPNEPVNRSIDLMNNQCDIGTLDALYSSFFPHNASVVALDVTNGEIVGVLLNIILKRNQKPEAISDPRWKPSPKYEKYLGLLTTLEREMNMKFFEKYPDVDNILQDAILSVSNKWQGDGISQIMVKYANDIIAKQLNCKLSFVICSSFFSAKVFEKCGYSEVFSKRFRDYKDGDEVLFPTDAPHEFMTGKLLDLRELNNNYYKL